MLLLLNSAFTLAASGPPASREEVAALQGHFESVPSEYVKLVGEGTEFEIVHSNGQYLRIWGPSGCIEMDEAYGITKRIPNCIPIGDDGGGHVIFYHWGEHGFGLYHLGYGNLDASDAVWIAPSLGALLKDATGVDAF